jgi:hypothetical protein
MSHLTITQELVDDLGILSLWQDTASRYNFSSEITCTDYPIPTKTYLRHCR